MQHRVGLARISPNKLGIGQIQKAGCSSLSRKYCRTLSSDLLTNDSQNCWLFNWEMSLSSRKYIKHYKSLSGISNLMLCIVGFLNPFQVLMSSAMLMSGMACQGNNAKCFLHTTYTILHATTPALETKPRPRPNLKDKKNFMSYKELMFTKFKP